jgi:hypothetical protein
MRPTCYLEIGVAQGFTFGSVKPYCDRAIGVDPVCGGVEGEIYRMTSDEFFAGHAEDLPLIELAFIDGDHHFEQVLKDLVNIVSRSAENALIFIHDTYPADEREKAEDRSGDSWKVPDLIRSGGGATEVLTLPFPPGLTVVRKVPHV